MGRFRKNTAVLASGPPSGDNPNRPTNRAAVSEQAYRQRKETTALSLRNQVEVLQTTIEELDRTFRTYHDKVETSDLLCSDTTLRGTLQEICEQFLAIVGASRMNADLGGALPTNGNASNVIIRRRNNRSPQLARRSSPVHMANPEQTYHSFRLSSGHDSSTSTPSTVDSSNPMPYNVDHGTFPLIVSPALLLPSSMTYFQETSFERRLHRACLKNGYDLLVYPTSDPDNVRRVFRLPLTFSDRDSIVRRVQAILEAGLEEAPEMWDMPFFLLGGAGTHYPRRDQGGRPILPPNSVPMNKLVSALAHQAAESQSVHTVDEFLAGLGLDGEWFDSYDVEGYLKEKGIALGGDTAFCKVPENIFPTELSPPGTVSINTLDTVQLEHSVQGYIFSGNTDLNGIHPSGHLQPVTQVSYSQVFSPSTPLHAMQILINVILLYYRVLGKRGVILIQTALGPLM
ncbi:unnamed protein product [Aspergillus oryzae]|uniref:Unnamed protein product n=1 Tax=Aspergillus oryzae TaxID=5062 RepID=A0AAN5BPQ0_ASPOZ|nr:unnamed protein product [Aspergillus oryzae]